MSRQLRSGTTLPSESSSDQQDSNLLVDIPIQSSTDEDETPIEASPEAHLPNSETDPNRTIPVIVADQSATTHANQNSRLYELEAELCVAPTISTLFDYIRYCHGTP